MELSKEQKQAFALITEPREEPDYMKAAKRLQATLSEPQQELLFDLMIQFGKLVQYERRWYFQKGWRCAAKKLRGKNKQ